MSTQDANYPSSDDQSPEEAPQKTPGTLTPSAIFASTLLLIIPAGIPLLFLSQVDSTTGLVVLLGTSACMLLLNAIVLVALMRWFRAMAQDG